MSFDNLMRVEISAFHMTWNHLWTEVPILHLFGFYIIEVGVHGIHV